MPKADSFWGRWWRTVLFFLVALAVAFSDQLSKGWIRENLAVNEILPVVGIFRLTHVQNTGVGLRHVSKLYFPPDCNQFHRRRRYFGLRFLHPAAVSLPE